MDKQLYNRAKQALKEEDLTYHEFVKEFTLDEVKEVFCAAGSSFNLTWRDSTTPKWMYNLSMFYMRMVQQVVKDEHSVLDKLKERISNNLVLTKERKTTIV